METPRSNEDASTLPVALSQVTERPNIVIKRSIFEVESMEVDEYWSHKKSKLFQVGGVLSVERSFK